MTPNRFVLSYSSIPLRLCFLMWLVYTIEMYLTLDFGYLGILPRKLGGMIGIITAPLIHGNVNHLVSNSIPVLVLGGTLFFFYPRIAKSVFLKAYFFTGMLVWIFGRPFYHIGASGVVYALASFLVFNGIFNRNFKSVLISLVIVAVYGGMAYGLLVLDSRISWESHLMGAIVGLSAAIYEYLRRKRSNY